MHSQLPFVNRIRSSHERIESLQVAYNDEIQRESSGTFVRSLFVAVTVFGVLDHRSKLRTRRIHLARSDSVLRNAEQTE